LGPALYPFPSDFPVEWSNSCLDEYEAIGCCLQKTKKVQKWIQRTKINIVLLFLVKIFLGEAGAKIEIIILYQQVVNKFCFLVRKMLARLRV
jgi:hypothetical protein